MKIEHMAGSHPRHNASTCIHAFLACFLVFWLQNVQAGEMTPLGAPIKYFRLDNGLAVPIPAEKELFLARTGGLGFSAIFQGVVDGQGVSIILTTIDADDIDSPGPFMEEAVRELRGGDPIFDIEVTDLIMEVDRTVPECPYMIARGDNLETYPGPGAQFRTHVGVIISRVERVFFQVFPSKEMSPALYSFIDAWKTQVGQKMKFHSEEGVDNSDFSQPAPYPRTGQTLKNFHIPLPFNDQGYAISSEDEYSIQFRNGDQQVGVASVTLAPDDVPYDWYMYETGSIARRITAIDSLDDLYDIYPQKVYESRYMTCSSWTDPHDAEGAVNVFFGTAYIDGRVLAVRITAPRGVALAAMGIEWLTSIFQANSQLTDTVFYDVRYKYPYRQRDTLSLSSHFFPRPKVFSR